MLYILAEERRHSPNTVEVGIGSYQHRREKFNLTHENKLDYSKRTKFIPEATRFKKYLNNYNIM